MRPDAVSGPPDSQLHSSPVPRATPGESPRPTHFPIGRGRCPKPVAIHELGIGGQGRIEPATRGFSTQRRAWFGAGKPKTGNAFSAGRPNRPARPSPCRAPGAGGPTEPRRKLKNRKGDEASQPSGNRTAALDRYMAWPLDQTDSERHQPSVRVFFKRAANSRWASACPSLTDHRSISSRSTDC